MAIDFMKVFKGLNFAGQASAPSAPANGDVYYDTTLQKLRCYQNGAWVNLSDSDGTVILDLGSAGSPSLSFTGDSNTGIFSPGADQLAITTAGSERLRVGSDASVLIGTTSNSFASRFATGLTYSAASSAEVTTAGTSANFLNGSVAQTTGANSNQFNGTRVRSLISSTNTQNWTATAPGLLSLKVEPFESSSSNTYTVSEYGGIYVSPQKSGSNATWTKYYGAMIDAFSSPVGTVTSAAQLILNAAGFGTNRTTLLMGTSTIPSGNWELYSTGTNDSSLAGSLRVGTTTTIGSGSERISSLNSGVAVGTLASATNALINRSDDAAVTANTRVAMTGIQRTITTSQTDTGAYSWYLVNGGTITIPSGQTYTSNGTWAGFQYSAPSISGTGTAAISAIHGVLVGASATNYGTGKSGVTIGAQSGSTNNVNLLLGTTTIPSGSYDIYSSSTNDSLLSGHLNIAGQKELRLQDTTGGEYVGLRASGTQTTYTITLPSSAPTSNTFLKYDGANYVWASSGAGGDVNNGGNSFGGAMTIGTNDAFSLSLETSGVSRVSIGTTGRVAFSGSVSSAVALYLTGSAYSLLGTAQFGIANDYSFDSAVATASIDAVYSQPKSQSTTGTSAVVRAFFAKSASKGASDTWTRLINFYGDAQTAGTNNAFIADNASFSGNFFIHSTDANPTSLSGNLILNSTRFTNGGTVGSSAMLKLNGNALTGASQIAVEAATFTSTSAATSLVAGFVAGTTTAAAAFTAALRANFYSQLINKGAGSTITRDVGYYVEIPTQGSNNAAFADNTTFNGDYFIHSTSTRASSLAGRLTAAGVTVSDNILATAANSFDIGSSGTRFASIFAQSANLSSTLVVSSNATVGGQVLHADGSSGTPSISFTNQTAMGLYRVSTDFLRYVGQDTTQFSIFNAGTNDDSILRLENNGSSTGDQYIFFVEAGVTASQWSLGRDDSDSGAFKLSQNSSLGTNDFFKIATTGRIDVRSASSQDAVLFMEPVSTGVLSRIYASLASGDTTGDAYYVAQVNGGVKWSWGLDNSDSDSLKISNADGVGTSDALSITNSTLNVSVVAGNLAVSTAGKGLQIKEGSNAKMGTSTLAAGTVTVSTTAVTANSRIFLTSQSDGGTPGFLRVTARTAGTSFTITSSSNTDTSTVAWILVEPA